MFASKLVWLDVLSFVFSFGWVRQKQPERVLD